MASPVGISCLRRLPGLAAMGGARAGAKSVAQQPLLPAVGAFQHTPRSLFDHVPLQVHHSADSTFSPITVSPLASATFGFAHLDPNAGVMLAAADNTMNIDGATGVPAESEKDILQNDTFGEDAVVEYEMKRNTWQQRGRRHVGNPNTKWRRKAARRAGFCH